MHMADALVSPAVAGTMYAASTAAAGYAVKKIKQEDLDQKTAVMGVMGAFVFATQMINFTIPGTGSSGHLCGGLLLSAILGPFEAFLTMIAILFIQCLLFADGGLLALGCNVWNMAFFGCFLGGFLIWKPMMRQGITKGKIIAASVLGSVISLQCGAFSVTLQTLLSGITELPFSVFAGTMLPIHLLIGLVEGLITAAVLVFVYETRPEILWMGGNTGEKKGRISGRALVLVFAGFTVIAGGILSLFASGNPDGLEWSLEKVAGTAELSAVGSIPKIAAKLQSLTAIFPDYAWKNSGNGTSFVGIFGAVVVLGVCFVICLLIRSRKGCEKIKTKKD